MALFTGQPFLKQMWPDAATKYHWAIINAISRPVWTRCVTGEFNRAINKFAESCSARADIALCVIFRNELKNNIIRLFHSAFLSQNNTALNEIFEKFVVSDEAKRSFVEKHRGRDIIIISYLRIFISSTLLLRAIKMLFLLYFIYLRRGFY